MSIILQQQSEKITEKIPSLLLMANKVAAAILQGLHGKKRSGIGEAFWQFRQYQLGDSPRHIDWRKSAKTESLYIKEKEWSVTQTIWLWCDVSDSMNYHSLIKLPSKKERAQLILLALAILFARSGEKIALLGSSFKPNIGRYAVHNIAKELMNYKNNQLDLFSNLSKNSQVILIGDFLQDLNDLEKECQVLANKNIKVYLIQIIDPVEEELPFEGRIQFQDMEQDKKVMFERVQSIREQYQKKFYSHRAQIQQLAQKWGWDFLIHRTDHRPEMILLTLYQQFTDHYKI
ncbi:MAG: DUF58 domain-containing protein [Alphaproteobacteria bacterium]|nr:DUF58 domain-containing protein [Alphaproteobacteria bacterium]